jgi:Fe-S oxidoreductase
MASLAPGLANKAMQSRVLGSAARRLGGLARERELPAFARETFREWFAHRRTETTGGQTVVLWPDTFTNYLLPETGKAAVGVLEAMGYRVELPPRPLCCGRPLYDYGMLKLAKRQLRQILEALRPTLRADVPVVGLEPSCVAVFRDELVNLLPEDEDAQRLSRQSFFLSEFLVREGAELPKLARKAIVHGHCHHKAIAKMTNEEKLLAGLGLEFEILDSGCCGLAGSFGYEADHYDISMQIGERALLPAVRAVDPDTLVVADGFSCRQQIAHATGRRALHTAEVLQQALREAMPAGARPAPARQASSPR